MQIVSTQVRRRQTPPGTSVEFLGRDGETIVIDLRGESAGIDDQEAIRRAKAAMASVPGEHEGAGVDQTLDQP